MESETIFSVIISSKAQKEISSSWLWYEERQQGLGDRFVKEVFDKIKNIKLTPFRYPTRYKFYKETPLSKFPFLVIYRVNKTKGSIRILSIFHTSLDPRKKY